MDIWGKSPVLVEYYMRIFAIVTYKGTNYQGWQRQPNVLTVQEVIETNLSKYFNREITIYGAGRTDAGVHALGQTFHFDVDVDTVDLDRLQYSLNSMLPDDIKIDDLEQVEEDFHARYSAKEKIYSYLMVLRDKDPFFYETMYVCPYPLDVKKMEECLTHFIGKHNFKNFTSKETDQDGFVREIYDITFEHNDNFVSILLRGNGFMRYMIRFIVGTALEVARDRMSIEEVDALLDDNSERNIVSFKAPANGLVLIDVKY